VSQFGGAFQICYRSLRSGQNNLGQVLVYFHVCPCCDDASAVGTGQGAQPFMRSGYNQAANLVPPLERTTEPLENFSSSLSILNDCAPKYMVRMR